MKLQGKEAFEDYYSSIFEGDEYDQFIDSLTEERLPILRFDPKNEEKLKQQWTQAGYEWKTLEWYPNALVWPEGVEKGTPLPGFNEHLIYPMNASSLLPVLALDIQENDVVLDACAAPGGKALMISEQLGEGGHVFANDLSTKRLKNMKYLIRNYNALRITTLGKKAETLQYQFPDSFTKILVDAPCSSEVHVYNNTQELNKWSQKRPQELRQRQINLVSSLVPCLKKNGTLVYSTCAITPEENEYVIEEILKKHTQLTLKENITLNAIYPGEKGFIPTNEKMRLSIDLAKLTRIFPHKHAMDPMFIAVLGL